MIRAPVPSDRWLPGLGIALLVLSAVVFIPWVHRDPQNPNQRPQQDLPAYYVSGILVALMGVGAWRSAAARRSDTPLPFLAVGVSAIVQALYTWGLTQGYSRSGIMILQVPASFLISAGAPFLWGSAIVREEHPAQEHAGKAGRVAAQVVLTGFICSFGLEALPYLLYWGTMGGVFSGSSGLTILYWLLRVGGRILLFVAVIETLRRPLDDEMVRTRASRIHLLLCGWFAFVAGNVVLILFRLMLAPSPNSTSGAPVWHSLVPLTLALTITCLAAQRYRPALSGGSSAP